MTSQCHSPKNQLLMANSTARNCRRNPLRHKGFHGIVGAASRDFLSPPAKRVIDDTRGKCD